MTICKDYNNNKKSLLFPSKFDRLELKFNMGHHKEGKEREKQNVYV
jgi:hypothetical protein